MSAYLKWDQDGERKYETGVDHGILFKKESTGYQAGEAWNGLTSLDESPSGAESNDIYADNMKYLSLSSAEDFGGTINAYTYPESFAECNGEKILSGVRVGQQTRKPFGMYYRTIKGNDTEFNDYGQVHHIVYNAKCSPSDMSYSTISDSPEAIEMSWEFKTTPVALTYKDSDGKTLKPTAIIKIDDTAPEFKTGFKKFILENLLNLLYGSDSASGKGYYPTKDTTPGQTKTYYTIEASTGTGGATEYAFASASTSGGFDPDEVYFEAVAGTVESAATVYKSMLPDPDQILTMFGMTAPTPA